MRHRDKIEATPAEGSLAAFVWRYEPDDSELPEPQTRSTSPASVALSKDLHEQG
ncbi:hypothetical protein Misp03_16590 [Microbispora sp. NBRC 16548]|nr:hypothetical protein Misp03_16590 [Microbispora sp. NBRC 16548]